VGSIATPTGPIAIVSGKFGLIADKAGSGIKVGDLLEGIDGYPDLGILSSIAPQLSGANFGPGSLSPINSLWNALNPLLALPVHMAVGDFDRVDSLSDVVVLDAGLPSLQFYTSQNIGNVAANVTIPLPASRPTFAVVADFNQDGWDDVAVCDESSAVTVHYLVAGARIGNFRISMGAISPTSMDVADFNNDGFPDIVVAGNSRGAGFAQVLLNSVLPRGLVSMAAQPTWGTSARFVEAFDADGNGWTDFAVANYGSHTVTVFLTQPVRVLPVNRDTRPIVCLEGPRATGIDIEPKFKYELQCGFYPTGIAVGDFDRNGKMDMAISLYSATPIIDPQVESCIEVIFDVACGTQPDQILHQITKHENQECNPCDGPCEDNAPPVATIETEGDSKNP